MLNDKWALERVLGVGGMAAVYAARHRNGARAAVKVLHTDLSRHPEVRERFLREGYAANRVEHPGAVKVLDDDIVVGGPDAGTAYLVMELLEGQSLQDRLEGGPPIGEREFLRIASGVLDVLEAAHARGVVHRDLKPENLFLLRDPDEPAKAALAPRSPLASRSALDVQARVKVLDFGLARLQEGQAITSYGLALGTPSFMSPEQAAGRTDEIDGRTDLFALAATGFRIRTGKRIHEGINPVDLVTKMASLAAPRIRSVTPDVSEPFARVVDRALEFRREDRYASAAAMRADVLAAIARIDAGVEATQVAMPPVPVVPSAAPAAASIAARAIDASVSAFEATESTGVVPGRPALGKGKPGRAHGVRSLLGLVALFVVGSVGAKLWFDAGGLHGVGVPRAGIDASAPDAAVTDDSSTGPPVLATGSSVVTDPRADDGGGETDGDLPPGPEPSASLAGRPSPPVTSASAPPTRRQPATHVGLGKVRKMPATHHARKTGVATAHP